MCFRHRTPFGVYNIIKEGGGVVPEVVEVDFSIVVTDDAHTGSVWCVRWGRGCPERSYFCSFHSLSLSLSLFLSLSHSALLSSFRKTFAVKNTMVILTCNLCCVKDLPIVD